MELIEEGHTAGAFFVVILLALIVYAIAKRGGFFRLPPPTRFHPVTFFHAFGAFLVYLILGLFLSQLFLLLTQKQVLGVLLKGWLQLLSLACIFIALIIYCSLINSKVSRVIFWGEKQRSAKRFFKGLAMGLLAYLVSYPVVLLVQLIAGLISEYVWGKIEVEQVAVEQLKKTLHRPALFVSMVFFVVVLVPFMEELLFRGFLQSFLKRYLKRGWAILLTAFLFALVHFAPSQGAGNFQLILSLFALSLFLGFIYEREQCLWAPLALHMTFNGLSVLFIVVQSTAS
ncbi:MAG: type II CAAX endopeptidase family protein [Chlamydiales bacterium]